MMIQAFNCDEMAKMYYYFFSSYHSDFLRLWFEDADNFKKLVELYLWKELLKLLIILAQKRLIV